MPKRSMSVILSVLLIAALIIPLQSFAATNIPIIINGQAVTFNQQPVTKNNTTLVLMRAFFEALGAKVEWDNATQTITGKRDNTTVELKIGSKTAKVNGQTKELLVDAQLINGSTYIPLRFVGEVL